MLEQSTSPKLSRVLGLFGAVMLTLSCITPASSLFIIVPEVLAGQGAGSTLTLLAGLVVSVGIGCCYAELGTLTPSSGGEYAMVHKLLGRFTGWITFGLAIALLIVIPPIIALGTADYLAALISVPRPLAGAVVMLLATLLAVLDVRSNALITGIFLAVEVVAATIVGALGFGHAQRGPEVLVAPGGGFTAGVLMAGLTVTMLAFNGFGTVVYLAEEIKEPRRNLPRAVFWSLGLAAVVIVLPATAAVLGVGSLDDLAKGGFPDFVRSWAGDGVSAAVSLGIVIAIMNAVIVMALQNARVLFASGRDRAWPEAVNLALIRLHPRWGSPWVATLVIGVPGIAMAALLNIEDLLGVTSVIVCLMSILLAVAALRARSGEHAAARAWRMPFWPVVPVVVIAALAYALAEQATADLLVAGGIVLVSALYYLLYLRPRPDSRWVVTTPEE